LLRGPGGGRGISDVEVHDWRRRCSRTTNT
jgi:hypothetical protein